MDDYRYPLARVVRAANGIFPPLHVSHPTRHYQPFYRLTRGNRPLHALGTVPLDLHCWLVDFFTTRFLGLARRKIWPGFFEGDNT